MPRAARPRRKHRAAAASNATNLPEQPATFDRPRAVEIERESVYRLPRTGTRMRDMVLVVDAVYANPLSSAS